jgi:hypothetical protein
VIDVLAYVDLGSGSLVVQLVIATIVAVPFLIRRQIGRAAASFRERIRLGTSGSKGGSTPS